MNLNNFNSWKQTLAGDGAITMVNNGRAVDISAGTGSALLEYFLDVKPFDLVRCSFNARADSGLLNCGIECPSGAFFPAEVIEDGFWRRYYIQGHVKGTYPGRQLMRMFFEIPSGSSGDVRVADMRIEMPKAEAARTHAKGVVRCVTGVASVNTDYVSYGISGVAYDSGTKTIVITVPPLLSTAAKGIRPIPVVAKDSVGGVLTVLAVVTAFSAGTGTVSVQLIDPATGTARDLSAGTYQFSFELGW